MPEQPKPESTDWREFTRGGHVDFRGVEPARIRELAEAFMKDFSNLDEDVQIELLEQFIGHDAITEAEALLILPDLDGEQKEHLGLYLGKVIVSEKYAALFHRCYPSLRSEDRGKIAKFIIDAHPEAALLVAPFVDLTIAKKGEYDAYFLSLDRSRRFGNRTSAEQEKENPPLFERFNDFQSAQKLLDACFTLHKNEDGRMKPYPIDSPLKSYLEKFKDSAPEFLFSKLEELQQMGPPGYFDLREMFERGVQGNTRLQERTFYCTKQEKERLADTEKLITQAMGNEKWQWGALISELSPRAAALERTNILQRAGRRRAGHVFGNFQKNLSLLGLPWNRKRLVTAADNDIPVFSAVREWSRDADDATGVFEQVASGGLIFDDYGDLTAILAYVNETKPAAAKKIEQKIVKEIVKSFQEFPYVPDRAARFVIGAKEAFPVFSPEGRGMLKCLGGKRTLAAWLLNPRFAVENGIASISEITAAAMIEPSFLLGHYHAIIYELAHSGATEEEYRPQIAAVQQKAREALKKEPRLLFANQAIVNELFPEETVSEIIRTKLRKEPDKNFLSALARSPSAGRFKADCQAIARENPNVISAILEAHVQIEEVKMLFGVGWGGLAIKSIETADAEPVLDSQAFFSYFTEHQPRRAMRDIVAACKKSGQLFALAKLIGRIQLQLQYYLKERKGDKETRDYFERAAEEATAALRDACGKNPDLMLEGDVLKVQGLGLADVVKRNIDRWAQLQPESIMPAAAQLDQAAALRIHDKYERNLLFFERESLFQDRIWGRRVRDAQKEKNPLIFAKQKENAALGSIYDAALYRLKASGTRGFYDFFRERMEQIAVEENKKHLDEDVDTRGWQEFRPEFAILAKRITVLELSPIAGELRAAAQQLSGDERQALLELGEIAADRNLDADFSADERHPDRLPAALRERVFSFTKKLFALEGKESEIDFFGFSIATLHAAATYFRSRKSRDLPLKKSLLAAMEAQAEGAYRQFKMWGKKSVEDSEKDALFARMKTDGELPSGISREQFEEFHASARREAEEILTASIGDVGLGVTRLLDQAVSDHHVKPGAFEMDPLLAAAKLETLTAPLEEFAVRQRELKAIFDDKSKTATDEDRDEYAALKTKIAAARKEIDEDVKRATASIYLNAFRRVDAKELASAILEVGKKRIPFADAFKLIEKAFMAFPEFVRDIATMREKIFAAREQMFGGARISKSSLTVTDDESFPDNLFIGEHPVPSCQHYESGEGYNNGLISYVADPNVRVLKIFDEEGKIIARSVLRLLEDGDGKPQLFLERVYSLNDHGKIPELLQQFAGDKARSMGVGLFTHPAEQRLELATGIDERYSANLRSRASRAPYVYTDAGGGLIKGGKYAIDGAVTIRLESAAS